MLCLTISINGETFEMLLPVNNIKTSYVNDFSHINNRENVKLKPSVSDLVSFTSKDGFVSEKVLKMLQKLNEESPVIGFKGDGKWLLPNLLKTVGRRYNLYLPDGTQLTYHKIDWGDCVLFRLKEYIVDEKVPSKIKLLEKDEHLEFKRIQKNKTNGLMSFRVNTKNANHWGFNYQEGKITKLIKNKDGSTIEDEQLSKEETAKINEILEKYLPDFF